MFCIYKDEDTIVESYTYTFTYYGENVAVSHFSSLTEPQTITAPKSQRSVETQKREAKKILTDMMKLVQGLPELPSTRKITLKLFYNEDITPPDYSPPGFEKAPSSHLHFYSSSVEFNDGGKECALGNLDTDFIRVACRAKFVEECEGGYGLPPLPTCMTCTHSPLHSINRPLSLPFSFNFSFFFYGHSCLHLS